MQGGLLNCSAEGFAFALDLSCHSFIRTVRLAAPLMTEGGTLFAMSFHGARKVVRNYEVKGPVKAALEAACRYLAYELWPRKRLDKTPVTPSGTCGLFRWSPSTLAPVPGHHDKKAGNH